MQFLVIFGTAFLAWESAKGFCGGGRTKLVLGFLQAVPSSPVNH
jgi:hypothetical protein